MEIGFNTKTSPEQLPLDMLISHCCFFLKPSNHFLVPGPWAGLGEVPEIIDEIRKFEAAEDIAFARANRLVEGRP